jgi:transcriptional regulator GlxA family with amidase domain
MGNGRIAASVKLVDSALEKGIKVGDIAPRVGLSRSRFGHLFKAQTGLTFRQYVRAARLARAKLLLRDIRLRVEEVAWRCGYAHTSNLDREFQREFELSPSDYRRGASG